MTSDEKFRRALEEHAKRAGAVMVGDVFVVDGIMYRIEAHDSFGIFHFEKIDERE